MDYLIVPYYGTSRPNDNQLENNGIYFPGNGNYSSYYVGVISTVSNPESPVFAFKTSASARGLEFLTLSPYYKAVGTWGIAEYAITEIVDGLLPIVYHYQVSFTHATISSQYDLVPHTLAEAAQIVRGYTPSYPIHYFHSDGCTITGPADAAPGTDVVITVNPAQGYAFRGSSGVDIRDSHGERVPFIVNGNQVAFTYPQPY